MIIETLLIPILNNVAGKLVDSGVEKLRSSHEVNVLRAISRSRLLREISLNLEVSKLPTLSEDQWHHSRNASLRFWKI